jgi:hypothetical protein
VKKTLPRWQAALESARRTFVQAALPAVVGALALANGHYTKAIVIAAIGSGGSAGIAAVMRIYKPIASDSPNVSVEGVQPR